MTDVDQSLRDAGARMRSTAPTAAATEAALAGLGDLPSGGSGADGADGAGASHGRRRRLVAVAVLAAAAAAVGVVVLTRPTSESVISTESTLPTVPTTAAPPASTAPSPSDPSPSDPSTAPTTAPQPSPSPLPGATWTDAPFPEFGLKPCCGANATGPTSPDFTPDGQPLADGLYAADVTDWSAADPTTLGISVRRLVPCADGVRECSPYADGTYGPDEVGVSDEERRFDLPLDGALDVELLGLDAERSAPDDIVASNRTTTGTGFAQLMSALAASYDDLVAAPLAAGAPVDGIVADLQANPRRGFSSAADAQLGLLYFTDGDAPSVLFQSVSQLTETNTVVPLPRSGTSAIDLLAVEVRDGQLTLYTYAGWVP